MWLTIYPVQQELIQSYHGGSNFSAVITYHRKYEIQHRIENLHYSLPQYYIPPQLYIIMTHSNQSPHDGHYGYLTQAFHISNNQILLHLYSPSPIPRRTTHIGARGSLANILYLQNGQGSLARPQQIKIAPFG